MVSDLTAHPLFGVALTLCVYSLAETVHARRNTQWLNPLVVSAAVIMFILSAGKIPVAHYEQGAKHITFWLGPAAVALAVPLYRQVKAWRRHMPSLFVASLLGSLVGLSVAPGLAYLLGADRRLVMALVPRSVTTPIAVELAGALGAVPEVAAGLVIVTGILGHVAACRILTLTGIRDRVARGLAMGVAAHGIGTARMLRESETEGAASGMGMSLAGLLTAVLVGLALSVMGGLGGGLF